MADNGTDRLARMQSEIDELRTDTRILLRAQVLHAGDIRDHGSRLDRVEKNLEELTERGKETDQRIRDLVSAIGELIRLQRGSAQA